MSRYAELPAYEIVERIKAHEIKAEDYIASLYERIKRIEKDVHAYITLTEDLALKKAREIDKKIEKGEKTGRLCGAGIAIKDNICMKGVRTTCASPMLEKFIPPYNATVVKRIEDEDGIILGKANMDEFAMGSSTEYSYFGTTHNPWDLKRVPGGSSGGSAAAIASSTASLALGSDTGGSIRCPASFCLVVGLKPTYGLVSRFGLIAYANSLEQIGPITKDVRDCALLLSCIASHDPLDSTSVDKPQEDYTKYLMDDINGIRIGVIKEFFGEGTQDSVAKGVWDAILKLEELGANYQEISLKNLHYALPSYYIIAMSEASSNLARYDGLRYGYRIPDKSYDWSTVYSKDRRFGFGFEVKRRIILGTFALSAGYYNEYYLKAQKIRTLIKRDFEMAFKRFDVLIGPTMPILPFKIGEKVQDPLEMYMCDVDTVPANLVGIPSISIPCGFSLGLPIGLQMMVPPFREGLLLRVAFSFQRNFPTLARLGNYE
ncbi:MAG: Asp-tRNA(Asn)/Glu-tRNA(Gln) amidotransferase subunit GatA [archaeon]|nr:Asp-tRNA(Asn)/Glu-tRNA(Gln) amidotransferase subunit GatA [archaeon]MCP8314879.1 Asp-tRNA(Asn)/Glu-tRNA(Gln) amidotransferase subunit GatA [archaeon]